MSTADIDTFGNIAAAVLMVIVDSVFLLGAILAWTLAYRHFWKKPPPDPNALASVLGQTRVINEKLQIENMQLKEEVNVLKAYNARLTDSNTHLWAENENLRQM